MLGCGEVGMTDELEAIRERHERVWRPEFSRYHCAWCNEPMPCDTALALAEVERLQEAPPPREWFVEVDSTCSLIAARYPSALPADIIRDLAAISASARRWAALGGEE